MSEARSADARSGGLPATRHSGRQGHFDCKRAKSFSASCRKGQVRHGESVLWRTGSLRSPDVRSCFFMIHTPGAKITFRPGIYAQIGAD